MDLENLTPVGGTLAGPVTPPIRQYTTAAFIHTPGIYTDPSAIWSPRAHEVAPPHRPLPGHGLEHEPLDGAERASEHTVQDVSSHEAAAARVRSALRPGG